MPRVLRRHLAVSRISSKRVVLAIWRRFYPHSWAGEDRGRPSIFFHVLLNRQRRNERYSTSSERLGPYAFPPRDPIHERDLVARYPEQTNFISFTIIAAIVQAGILCLFVVRTGNSILLKHLTEVQSPPRGLNSHRLLLRRANLNIRDCPCRSNQPHPAQVAYSCETVGHEELHSSSTPFSNVVPLKIVGIEIPTPLEITTSHIR